MSIYTDRYTNNAVVNYACLDPIQRHKRLIKSDLIIVNEKVKLGLSTLLNVSSHVGQKICKNCLRKVREIESHGAEQDCAFTPEASEKSVEASVSSINNSIMDFSTRIKVPQVLKLLVKRQADYLQEKASHVKQGFSQALSQAIRLDIQEKDELSHYPITPN